MSEDNLTQISILVVENESPVGDLIETVLGVVDTRQIYKATNSAHGHVLFQAIGHDLIIIDVDIKSSGAIEFVKAIRDPNSAFSKKDVPVIMMASYAADDILEQARAIGIDDLLVKPFAFDDLIKCIGHVMKRI